MAELMLKERARARSGAKGAKDVAHVLPVGQILPGDCIEASFTRLGRATARFVA